MQTVAVATLALAAVQQAPQEGLALAQVGVAGGKNDGFSPLVLVGTIDKQTDVVLGNCFLRG